MYIFLIRHAEGADSKDKWQTPETPLSKLGIEQSTSLMDLPRFKDVDLILTSKFKRAFETAQVISNSLNKPLEVFDGIEERRQHPKIYGSERASDLSKQYINDHAANYGNLDWKFENQEESIKEVTKRASDFIKHLIDNHSDKRIVVVSHDAFIKCFITVCILGEKFDDAIFHKIYRSLEVMNTGISLLKFDETKKTWKVLYLNDFSHLGKVKIKV